MRLENPLIVLSAGVLALLIANRIAYAVFAAPLPDEAYYWLWGRHPQLSYFDHPPLQAWMQGAAQAVFGTHPVVLRLPPALSTLTIAGTLLYWARRFGLSGADTLALLATVAAIPLLHIYTAIAFNDHIMLALLALATIPAARLFDRLAAGGPVPRADLYLTGLLIGLAGLGKYNAALFGIGLAVAAAWHPGTRRLYRSPHLYLAMALALACLTPVFAWNVSNDWASFAFNLSERLSPPLGLVDWLDRLYDLTRFFALIASPFALLGLYRVARGRVALPEAAGPLVRIAVPVFLTAFAICFALLYKSYILFYWLLPALVAALPLIVFGLQNRWLRGAHLLFGALAVTLHTANQVVLPIYVLLGVPDRESTILHGWPEIAARVEAARDETGITAVQASDYRLASMLAFALDDPTVRALEARRSQFTLWRADEPAPDAAILLTDAEYPLSPEMTAQYDEITELPEIVITRFGYTVHRYQLYLGRGGG
jgi:4-amino-4-deoxy-L-arabinose transferase-like glycosyltransferase